MNSNNKISNLDKMASHKHPQEDCIHHQETWLRGMIGTSCGSDSCSHFTQLSISCIMHVAVLLLRLYLRYLELIGIL